MKKARGSQLIAGIRAVNHELRAMMKGIFITGTDTGVGKTYVAAGIAAELRRRGVDVGVMKPAETGCKIRGGRLVPADALLLMKSAGVSDPLSLVNPCRFRMPLAPAVAAKLEGKKIDIDKILDDFRTLSQKHDFMIVEGAGGIMVPLSGQYLYLDLAADLGLPAVIVSRPDLGTINHTLLTVSALREKEIPVRGIVINHARSGKNGMAEKTNTGVIESLSKVKILGITAYGCRDFSNITNGI